MTAYRWILTKFAKACCQICYSAKTTRGSWRAVEQSAYCRSSLPYHPNTGRARWSWKVTGCSELYPDTSKEIFGRLLDRCEITGVSWGERQAYTLPAIWSHTRLVLISSQFNQDFVAVKAWFHSREGRRLFIFDNSDSLDNETDPLSTYNTIYRTHFTSKLL